MHPEQILTYLYHPLLAFHFFCQSGHKKLNYYTELVLCSQDSNRFCRTKAVLEFHFFDAAPLSTV